jgi:hypothetical protein
VNPNLQPALASPPLLPSLVAPSGRPDGAYTAALVRAAAIVVVQAQVAAAAGRGIPSLPTECEMPLAARIESLTPEAVDLPELQPTQSLAAAKGASSPIRVHIEEGPLGVQLWLGLDGTPAEAAGRASAIAAELRRQCERAGIRLAGVTCNGLAVAGRAPVPVISREEP